MKRRINMTASGMKIGGQQAQPSWRETSGTARRLGVGITVIEVYLAARENAIRISEKIKRETGKRASLSKMRGQRLAPRPTLLASRFRDYLSTSRDTRPRRGLRGDRRRRA